MLGGLARCSKVLGLGAQRAFSTAAGGKPVVTLIPGDGIGIDVTSAVREVFAAAEVPIEWEVHTITQKNCIDKATGGFNPAAVESIKRNKVALKGPMFTPYGEGHYSLDVLLNKTLKTFAHVVPIHNIPGVRARYKDINITIVRENTEGEYSGLEHEILPGVVESLKVITKNASTAVAEAAFLYATQHNKKKVTAVHKANIMKKTDGLFLACCRETAKKFPNMPFEEIIVDNCAMQLVKDPYRFSVLLTPNLYGSILTSILSGITGGPGLTAGANFGSESTAVFEQGARHVGQDIAGKNVANPSGMIFAACWMLRHIKLDSHASLIENAIWKTFSDGEVLTFDIGGWASTTQFTHEVIKNLGQAPKPKN